MKRKLTSLIVAFGLVVCSSLSTSVSAHGINPTSLDGTNGTLEGCSNCGQPTVLICQKLKYYCYDYPHKSNGQPCTVVVYESPYAGLFCVLCNTKENMPDTDYSKRHPCTERHSSCGLGLIDRPECLSGDSYPPVAP